MTVRSNHERTAPGKTRIGFTLPKRLVASVDVVVGYRHVADDWVTRVEVVEECLTRFFETGGMAGTAARPNRSRSDRRIFKMNMDKEMIRAVYADANAVHTSADHCPPWLVVTTAILRHLPECLPPPIEPLTFTPSESIFTNHEDCSTPDVSIGRTGSDAGGVVRDGN